MLFRYGYHGFSRNNVASLPTTAPENPWYIDYMLNLPAGDYIFTTGHFCWNDGSLNPETPAPAELPTFRNFNVIIGNAAPSPATPVLFENYGEYAILTHPVYRHEGGDLKIRVDAVDYDGVSLTFIGAQKAEGTASAYTITFDPDNGTGTFTQQVADGAKVQKPADPVNEGWLFIGWYANGSETIFDFNTPITGNITLTARYVEIAAYASLIINQATATGGTPDGTVQYSFVELYNPTNEDVDLSLWSLPHRETDGNGARLDIEGGIPAYQSYLVRITG
jgi:uncharacterized repeat protein (TIGR02543 family)